MWLFDCGLESFEWRRVIVIYLVASSPIFLSIYLAALGKLKRWTFYAVITSFIIAVFGWELWLNFGLLDGQPVDLRRSGSLSCAIPYQINWLTNSLGDAAVVWFGIIILSYFYRNTSKPFESFTWSAFIILLFWFLSQNIWVEVIFYFNQVGGDARLSWAPLMPFGSWFNPTLMSLGDRHISFQGQSAWIIATPIYYYLMIFFYRKTNGQ